MTTVTIRYGTIIERCKMLSAFEGQTLADGNGESRYRELRLTDREKDLMLYYIKQGIDKVETFLGRGVSIEALDNDESMHMLSGKAKARVGNAKVARSMEETLVSWTLALWFENKDTERSNAYKQMYADMLETAKRMVYRKKEPDWDEEEDNEADADASETGAESGEIREESGETSDGEVMEITYE